MPGADADTAVALRDVRKSFGTVEAVRGVSLDVPAGQTVALLGPNGAGKSTTIGMMLGSLTPDAGEVLITGRQPRSAVRDGRIAAMLQDTGLMPGIRVGELVSLARSLYPDPLGVGEALDLAGLTDVRRRRVDRLSGGQAQRLKFTLVAVANPSVMVLDEPTRAMDVGARRDFWTAMRGYAAGGRTILFATHYLDEVEENADRVVMMTRGGVIADGSPDAIRTSVRETTLRFRLDPPAAETAREHLAALPGLAGPASVQVCADRVTLRSVEPDAVVRALVASSLPWLELSVEPPSLDDAFLRLTTEEPVPQAV
jgi:ABC-2 type transport system ATP-binding protein